MWNVFLLTVALSVRTQAVSRPAITFLEPDYVVYYRAGETVQMECKAYGVPEPSYYWYRNESIFNPNGDDDRIVQLPGSGTLVINMPEDKDEGIFQCFAFNDFGRSASKKINLRQVKLLNFENHKPIYHKPQLGKPYTLPCVPPESVPASKVFWITKTASGSINIMNYDARVSVDSEYNLRITHVKTIDRNNNAPYACMVLNDFMRSTVQGPLHYIDPQGVTEDYTPVSYLWADQEYQIGLVGSNFSVKCIFAGNPTPVVHWERKGNTAMSYRVSTRSLGQEMTITNLQFVDAGTYECWATSSNRQERLYRTFNISVNAKPYFLKAPKIQQVIFGDSAEFTCIAGGVPKPSIEWFVNGVSVKDVKDPRITDLRFKRTVENKVILEDVQLTDHMVLQCNASNIHGYVFANAVLNVLSDAPTFINAPQNETVTEEGQEVALTCKTDGDPDPIITWFKDGVQITKGQSIDYIVVTEGRYTVLNDGTLVIQSVVLADAGQYMCQAKNWYGEIDASGTIVVRRNTSIEVDKAPVCGSGRMSPVNGVVLLFFALIIILK